MPDYLPLCAFRQDLLPTACRTCSWWFTSGFAPDGHDASRERRREWMISLESTWGSTGLILPRDAPSGDRSAPVAAATIHYAPAASLPRLRDLPLGPLPPDSVVLFCMRMEAEDRAASRRLLQKALAQLRQRHVAKVYAYAAPMGGTGSTDHCEFFSRSLLEDCGFTDLRDNGELFLMFTDLRGLATLLGRIDGAIRRALGTEPDPSPAAWTRRGT